MDIEQDPVTYPKIRLRDDKEEYDLRFPLEVVIALKKEQGIDICAKSDLTGVDALERMLVMVQAGVSHSRDVSVQALSKMFDLRDVKWISELMAEALKPVSQSIASITPAMGQPTAIQ